MPHPVAPTARSVLSNGDGGGGEQVCTGRGHRLPVHSLRVITFPSLLLRVGPPCRFRLHDRSISALGH